MKMKKLAGSLLALALLSTACAETGGSDDPRGAAAPTGDPGTDATSEPAPSDTVEVLRLAATRGSGYPHPFAWVRGPGWIHAGYIFDTLLWEDSTGEPIPWLASDWEHSDDGTEWTFTIHEDATWHDGEDVTAQDVVFTYEYMTEGAGAGKAGFAAGGLRLVSDVAAQDDDTVTFTLEEPVATFIEDVAQSVLIVPEHIWADVTDPDQKRDADATIGSGPYTLDQHDEATGAVRYVANEAFHLGAPVVESLEFVPVEDELIGLQRGELHAAEAGLEDPIPEEQLSAFESDPAIEREDSPGDWNRVLHFNMSAGFPYDEVTFRQAIAYAIDREDLVERILFGRGEPGSTGALAPAHPFTVDGLATYERDVDEANELLDELGLMDTDGDGFRELADGSPWEQELKASTRFSAQTPELIGEYLRDVGIDIDVNVLEQAAADEAASNADYTMTLVGYGGIMGDPDGLRQRFHTDSQSIGHSNVHGYSNARFDELAEQQLVLVDPAAREPLVAEMQQILAEELPVLSLYVPDRTLFYANAVFDAWYGTPGCSPCRASRNKHMFVTGQKVGFP